jgi:carbonic anhydrase
MSSTARHIACLCFACALAVCWVGAASASAEPETLAVPPKSASKSASKAAVKARPAQSDELDPLDALRDKLTSKLGAVQGSGPSSSKVLRVVAPSDHGQATPTIARAASHAAPVAKLRPSKTAPPASRHSGHDWAYGGAAGPEHWGDLKPEFAACSSGSRQSPIDIRSGIRVDQEPIVFDYRASVFRVIDNGHTIEVRVGGGNSIEVQGRRFDLLQFHFHRPSEERIDGRQFDMVVHLVHRDPEGRLAVLAVLLDRGSAHPLVQSVWNHLPLEKNVEVAASPLLDLSHLLPADRRYFAYMGSLTTPPCTEGVLWLVMQQPVPIAVEQVNVFSRLYPMNARPVQPAAGRLIKQSN